MCGWVRLLTELRVVVLIKHTLEKAPVSIVFNRLRGVQVAFSSVHTHLILSVCVPMMAEYVRLRITGSSPLELSTPFDASPS